MSRTTASRRRSYGSHFSKVETVKLQRSIFDRSHNHKLTFGMSVPMDSSGKPTTPDKAVYYADRPSMLTPIYVDEVLPGDTIHCKATAFIRMSTPLVPLMDNLNVDLFAFYVPSRLLWTNLERFYGAQDDPGDSTDFSIPQVEVSGAVDGASDPMFYGDPANGYSQYRDLQDYFGIPGINAASVPAGSLVRMPVNALPFRAYNFIWNYWFRDQNIQKSAKVNLADGGDDEKDFTLLPRGARHDFFHSCLPWQQKGDDPTISIGGRAPVHLQGNNFEINEIYGSLDGAPKQSIFQNNVNHGAEALSVADTQKDHPQLTGLFGNVVDGNGYADLTQATGINVSQFRQLFQIQHFLERQARGGTRFKELLRSHFRVTVSDERLDYPEFLGSGSVSVNQSTVPQTSSTDTTTPQGNLAAFSQSLGQFGFSKSFVEPGYIMILAAPRADYTYSQGLNRLWSRKVLYDFYFPEFSHLSEQPIFNRELLFTNNEDWNSGIFGFNEYGSRYRWNPNRASHLMRSNVTDSLAVWHMGQTFSPDGKESATIPATLSPAFIAETPPVGRFLAVPSQPHFLMDCFFSIKEARPMPVRSTPGLVDHF